MLLKRFHELSKVKCCFCSKKNSTLGGQPYITRLAFIGFILLLIRKMRQISLTNFTYFLGTICWLILAIYCLHCMPVLLNIISPRTIPLFLGDFNPKMLPLSSHPFAYCNKSFCTSLITKHKTLSTQHLLRHCVVPERSLDQT